MCLPVCAKNQFIELLWVTINNGNNSNSVYYYKSSSDNNNISRIGSSSNRTQILTNIYSAIM